MTLIYIESQQETTDIADLKIKFKGKSVYVFVMACMLPGMIITTGINLKGVLTLHRTNQVSVEMLLLSGSPRCLPKVGACLLVTRHLPCSPVTALCLSELRSYCGHGSGSSAVPHLAMCQKTHFYFMAE